jgi:hypothetical protein
MHRSVRTVLAATTAVVALALVGIGPAEAGGATGIYKNCKTYNHQYPHGVGKQHAHDKTNGKKVRNFKHSNELYMVAMMHNRKLDKDKDGIACEKR